MISRKGDKSCPTADYKLKKESCDMCPQCEKFSTYPNIYDDSCPVCKSNKEHYHCIRCGGVTQIG